MISIRQGEQGQPPHRSERFFKKETYWYYTTREGVEIGPYDNRSMAEEGCALFVDYIRNSDPSFAVTLQQYRSH
ncbi:DUF6316 family protein [Pseudomaricurvus sp. HS19]|uniref:DUF6316 family protein n=1 Tax=Pseudomaricurvus sp. HS19 TaxID=2692626 RepID=UPI00136F3510|nr:DUF6316 family protein [Pseudomaricurvus sp. HS19]MYM63612.1 hypothetical protein [Pseudomaricurvus sp. HS19]